MNLPKNQTCFFCKHYYHANPDDDKCSLSGKIVYIDTPCCSNFQLFDSVSCGSCDNNSVT